MPIGRLLAVTGRLTGQHVQRLLEAHGLTHAGWVVLTRLAEQDGLTQRELADSCFVSAATITGVVDTLERDGLVTRVRTSDDRRVSRLSLTPDGRERIGKCIALVAQEMGPIFAGVTDREEAVVRRFLVRTLGRLADKESPA